MDRREALDDSFVRLLPHLRGSAKYLRRSWGGARSGTEVDEIVAEAYLRLLPPCTAAWKDDLHFIRLARVEMERFLIDCSRALTTARRGGALEHLPPTSLAQVPSVVRDAFLAVAIREAVESLGELGTRTRDVAELHLIADLTLEQVADRLRLSIATAGREAKTARAALCRALADLRKRHRRRRGGGG